MRCEDCSGYEVCKKYGDIEKAEHCNKANQTNFEFAQSCTIKELAELITDIRDNDIYANNGMLEPLIFKLVGIKKKEQRKNIILEWLKDGYKG